MTHEHASSHHKPSGGDASILGNQWAVAALVFGVLFIATLALLFASMSGMLGASPSSQANTPINKNATAVAQAAGISDAAFKAKIEAYLDKNFLSAQNLTGEVASVEQYDAHLKLVTVNIKQNGTVLQPVPIYVTNDGESVILSGEVLRTNETVPTQQPTTPAATTPSTPSQPPQVTKTDKPVAQAFIMAYCPYGLQFLKAYEPVIELLGNKADLQVNFVYYSMHGKKEVDANSDLYCVEHEQKAKFAPYLKCFVETGDAQACVATAGVDANALSTCVAALDAKYNITNMYNDKTTWLSGNYPRYTVEQALNDKYGVGGSPTFILNGQEVNVDRTAESIKEAICASFSGTPPTECATALKSTAEQPGNGPIGSTSTTGATASCG